MTCSHDQSANSFSLQTYTALKDILFTFCSAQSHCIIDAVMWLFILQTLTAGDLNLDVKNPHGQHPRSMLSYCIKHWIHMVSKIRPQNRTRTDIVSRKTSSSHRSSKSCQQKRLPHKKSSKFSTLNADSETTRDGHSHTWVWKKSEQKQRF